MACSCARSADSIRAAMGLDSALVFRSAAIRCDWRSAYCWSPASRAARRSLSKVRICASRWPSVPAGGGPSVAWGASDAGSDTAWSVRGGRQGGGAYGRARPDARAPLCRPLPVPFPFPCPFPFSSFLWPRPVVAPVSGRLTVTAAGKVTNSLGRASPQNLHRVRSTQFVASQARQEYSNLSARSLFLSPL